MKPLWYSLLDERQQKEVDFAKLYVRDFNHGTTGHNQLVLIAKLAELIETKWDSTQGNTAEKPDQVDQSERTGIV